MSRPIIALPGGITISETGKLPAPHEFSLVSSDKFGNPQPLPSGLGNLPLYLDHDGFFSVNGPLDLTVDSARTAVTLVNHDAIQPLITNIAGFSDANPRVAPDHYQYINDDGINRFNPSPLNSHPP